MRHAFPETGIVARTLVSAASRIVSTLFQDCSEVGNLANIRDGHRDESRCGSLKAAPRWGVRLDSHFAYGISLHPQAIQMLVVGKVCGSKV
jgi:hypothetical protein